MIYTKIKKMATATKKFMVGAVFGGMVSVLVLTGCAINNGSEGGRESERATTS